MTTRRASRSTRRTAPAWTVGIRTAATRFGGLAPNLTFADGGLDFDADGNLWAILDYRPPDDNRPSDIVRIDLVTGAATFVAATLPEMEGLAISPIAAPRPP